MEKMKYKMASRATILLGRESVSKADGAIIELIKNTYDADADFGYICFDAQNDHIYIVDNGTGMTKTVIENCWMMIGTDNKQRQYYSSKKRIKAGEKGIGRFALDRLGSMCTMFTKCTEERLIRWKTDWSNFEVHGRMLDEVEAEFEYMDIDFVSCIPSSIVNSIRKIEKEKGHTFSLETGTVLDITGLRDKWKMQDIIKAIDALSFLVPPGEQTSFIICAQENIQSEGYEIASDVCNDFDYRVNATFDGKEFLINVERNELDFNIIPSELLAHERFSAYPYNYENLKNGSFTQTYSIAELMNNSDLEYHKLVKGVGPFKFTYVFMKTNVREDGRGVNYYKTVSQKRKKWLDEYAGIKIYRDNFVVRPYGDKMSNSFDWLHLDARKGVNPVAASDKSGKWHVSNARGQGTVFISRVYNSSILDKSSREGIIENEYFAVFCEIIREIISVFEKDRAYIARTIRLFTEEQEERENTKREAGNIADTLLEKSDNNVIETKNSVNSASKKLAKAVKYYEEEVEDLASEIRLLRALATNGLITSSMIHDLKSINAMFVSRVDTLEEVIKKNQSYLIDRHLSDLRTNDEFLKSWITVITSQSIRDRRTRTNKNIILVLQNAINRMSPILRRKKVNINFSSSVNVFERKIFEIDFDSIVYNLIVNSIESFERAKVSVRNITIRLECVNDDLVLHYYDTGAGISEIFAKNPYSIFEYGVSSKYDQDGNKIGTGLGMYIVASSILEYGGHYLLTEVNKGFGIDIMIPKGDSR